MKPWMVLAVLAGCAAPKPVAEPVVPAGRVLWQASVDLDGDGKPEALSISSDDVSPAVSQTDSDPRIDIPVSACVREDERCAATLRVGPKTHAIELQSGYFGGFGVEIVDVDHQDRRRELVFTQRGGNGEDPWAEFTVVTWDGKDLRVHPLWHSNGYNTGEVFVDGSGSLIVFYDDCPDAFTVTYRLDAGKLVETGRKTERVQDPEKCAG